MTRLDRWHLPLSADVAVSFQRFPWPAAGIVRAAPSSLGALPVALSADRVTALLPVASGEAFWIGLDPLGARKDAGLALCARLASGRVVDVVSGRDWNEDDVTIVRLRTLRRIEGIARPDGAFDAFGRAPGDQGDSCTGLAFRVADAASAGTRVTVDIVDYGSFEQRSGDAPPAPLDPAAGYRGHRLP